MTDWSVTLRLIFGGIGAGGVAITCICLVLQVVDRRRAKRRSHDIELSTATSVAQQCCAGSSAFSSAINGLTDAVKEAGKNNCTEIQKVGNSIKDAIKDMTGYLEGLSETISGFKATPENSQRQTIHDDASGMPDPTIAFDEDSKENAEIIKNPLTGHPPQKQHPSQPYPNRPRTPASGVGRDRLRSHQDSTDASETFANSQFNKSSISGQSESHRNSTYASSKTVGLKELDRACLDESPTTAKATEGDQSRSRPAKKTLEGPGQQESSQTTHCQPSTPVEDTETNQSRHLTFLHANGKDSRRFRISRTTPTTETEIE
ncbi:hypothetical protein FQN54_008130 [Arachnomyces sp. PD_36]|nr:hypothetical protein FQN54_008130 [Arachnomyces sp. PD_36]